MTEGQVSDKSGAQGSGQRLLSLLLISLALLAVLFPPLSQAQYPSLSPTQYPVPADMSGVHFYLITVDVGDSVWDNFGHTALRVYDENTNTDLVYNWGVFDISGGVIGFSFNFFKGIMNYRLATTAPALEFDLYRSQQRTVWQDRINLTNPQKEILYRRLMWNADEGNREYAYQYYFDNCTTRVRDYLDEALDGSLSASYAGVTEESFRDQVQTHYASTSLIAFSLDVLMNSNIDRDVTEWESMYLPLTLRERLAVLESDVAEDGKRLPLLSDQQIIAEFSAPTVESDPYRIASVGLLAPAFFLLLMLKRIPMSYFATHSRIGFKFEGLNFRLLGLLGLITALFSGIYGTLMLGSWFISDHLDTHHNVNLLLFWPTDLLGVVVALRWLFLCKPWPTTNNSAQFINNYLLAHVVGMLIYAAVALLGLSNQELDRILLYVVPGFFLFTVLIWVVGFQPAKPKNMFF
ncbi:MAG: DUF4105 domain-containing protein [Pseudomonadales bacterium]|nr:DUF4105 domain-containing protein [Pseudomonadales bacterium]